MWPKHPIFTAGLLFVLWAAPLSFGGAAPATQPTTKPLGLLLWDCSDDEYAIYNALLNHLYVEHKQTALADRIGDVGPVIDQLVLSERTLDARFSQGRPLLPNEKDDELMPDCLELDAPRLLKQCPEALRAAFQEANLKPAQLQSKRFAVPGIEIILLQQDEYSQPEQPQRTHPYIYAQYPRCQGVTLLSRVGFSADRELAVVTESTNRAFAYGRGTVYMLKKENDRWKVIAEKRVWTS